MRSAGPEVAGHERKGIDLDNVKQIRKNILVIDDEQGMLESLEELFGSDFNVFTASDGRHGLSLLESVRVDLILLDLKLAGMDGTEVLKAIRKFSKTVPVIIMTGHSTIERAEKCAGLSVQGYIRKPFDAIELLENVKEMLIGTTESGYLRVERPDLPDGLSEPVRGLLEFIGSHYTERLRPGDFAARVSASREYLEKKVRKKTGHSIGDHVNRLRVEKVKHLLLEKAETKISVIWRKAGFRSESQFRRVFKRYTGKTPAAFRKSPT